MDHLVNGSTQNFAKLQLGSPSLAVGQSMTSITQDTQDLVWQMREQHYQLVFGLSQIGIWDWDLQTDAITCNAVAAAAFGLSPTETQVAYQTWRAAVHGKDIDWVEQLFRRAFTTREEYDAEYRVIRPDGSLHWVLVRGQGIHTADGHPVRMVGVVMDISDRKRDEVVLRLAEEAWQENQQVLDTIMSNLPGGVFRCLYRIDQPVAFIYASEAYRELLDLSPQAISSQPQSLDARMHPEDRPLWETMLRSAQQTLEPTYLEYRAVLPTGTEKWLARTARFSWATNGDFVVDGIDIDITDRKQTEAALKETELERQRATIALQQLNQELEARVEQRTQELIVSLDEKEVLLKEIHHRVKNNLQMIQSLLNLQARSIQDPHTLTVFTESQQRIKAMALVHEKLYQSDRLAQISFAEYVRSLTRDLIQSCMFNPGVQVSIQVDELDLAVDAAIPCGLIINELFANAIKYAFPQNRSGTIFVQFTPDPAHGYRLVIADTGIGLPESVDPQTTKSLGLRLVHALTRQLRGTLELDRSNGTRFTITFARPI